jgi:hypothetical protein
MAYDRTKRREYLDRPEVRAREAVRSATRKEERAAYRRTPRGKLLHSLRSAESRLKSAPDDRRRVRILLQIRSIEAELHRLELGSLRPVAAPANRCEPSGFVSGTVQYVIRFLPGHGYGLGGYLASHGPHAPDPAAARKFATVADAVCYVETACKPDFLRAWVAHQPGRVPTGRFVVVPELDPERVVWPASSAGEA